ncbi:hypothetical protein D3C76_354820 [compost metagenome]
MIRRTDQKVRGSWLSLFAMLMIFIGPLISQAMPMDHRMPMSMTSSMNMGVADPGCHDAGHHGEKSQGSNALPINWEKCGYCSLLFQCPALPQAFGLAFCDVPRHTGLFNPQTHQGYARQAIFPGARTRAPPTFQHV